MRGQRRTRDSRLSRTRPPRISMVSFRATVYRSCKLAIFRGDFGFQGRSRGRSRTWPTTRARSPEFESGAEGAVRERGVASHPVGVGRRGE